MRTHLRILLVAAIGCIIFFSMLSYCSAPGGDTADKELRTQCLAVLHEGLKDGVDYVKVHAAEALLQNGYPEGVEKEFLPVVDTAPPEYRIGVWRVLVQAYGRNQKKRSKYLEKIVDAFRDEDGPDRLHAIEGLGKLGYSGHSDELLKLAEEPNSPLQVYASWMLANSGNLKYETALASQLKSSNPDTRLVAAYSLRFMKKIQASTRDTLRVAAGKEPEGSASRVYVLSALYVHEAKKKRLSVKDKLLKYAATGNKGEKYEVCSALARAGTVKDTPLLKRLLADKELDVRISAANALLAISTSTSGRNSSSIR